MADDARPGTDQGINLTEVRLRTQAERDADGTTWRPPFRIVESDAIPPDTVIVGDFSEFARAAAEDRPVNPRAFVRLDLTPPAPRRRWWHRYTRRAR